MVVLFIGFYGIGWQSAPEPGKPSIEDNINTNIKNTKKTHTGTGPSMNDITFWRREVSQKVTNSDGGGGVKKRTTLIQGGLSQKRGILLPG